MEQDLPRDFACPRCQARYKIVRMRSEPGIVHQMLQCRVCEEQLASTENDHLLKYFLVSRPAPRGSFP
jgi:transcription elongation factor Elf1